MAPPTTKARLANIDPVNFGREVADRVVHHLARYVATLSPGVRLEIDCGTNGLESSGVALSATDLCRWTQTGTGEHPDEARDSLQALCEALYVRPCDEGTYAVSDLDDDADPTSDFGAVVVAAACRLALLDGEAVTPRWLGALASVDAEHVRLLARRGELALVDGEISAEEARRWLSGRGVKGFEGKRRRS